MATTEQGSPAGADGSRTAGTIDVRRPTDGHAIGRVPVDAATGVAEVARRLRAAQRQWDGEGFAHRRRWLFAWRDWLFDNQRRLADLLQEETGKVRAEADYEVPTVAAVINYYGSRGRRFIADERPRASFPLMKTKRLRVVHRPYEVVGVIGPWNLPALLTFIDVVPALAAGCAVVVKPSELTPLTVTEMTRGWRDDVGAPNVLAVVNGFADTGAAVVDSCDFVQFTGSASTGRVVARRAAEQLTPCSLELSGKDPMIVLADANLDRAANAAVWGSLANAGQVCFSVERIYVEAGIFDELSARVVEKVSALHQGADGREYEADVGAMTSPAQMEVLADQVADACGNGARLLTGGRVKPGTTSFYEPTVLVNVDHGMKIMRDETFGPIVALMRVRDADEAIRLANDCDLGLSASVFTRDSKRAQEIARRIDAGGVNVNDVFTNSYVIDLPLGGWKHSGIGSRNGPDGMRKYCRTQAIVSSRVPLAKAEPLWFPYSRRHRRTAARVYQFLVSRRWRHRLAR
jgi:acyl-CoA reductase-like NAD-dependent aldehyde dehydrogenase